VRLHIEKPIYGGAGLARHEGKAVFVPFTLPGEEVEAQLRHEKGGYATAELETVLTVSSSRAEPPCPYFGRCGGCHYQHADYASQVRMKASILRETLERAHIREIPEIEVVAADPLAYRNRVRLHVRSNPFSLCYKMRESHVDLPIMACPIAGPALQQAIEILTRNGNSLGLAGWAAEIELFTNNDESSLLLALWTEHPPSEAKRLLHASWPRIRQQLPQVAGAGVFSSERGKRQSKLLAHCGQDCLRYRSGGRAYRVSLGAFFQVNRFLIEALVQSVIAGETGSTAWDLYAGVGLFSLPLTERFRNVVAVESSPVAVRDLRENLRGSASRLLSTETVSFVRQATQRREPAPDLVVVDPPRAGLGREVASLLGKIHPSRITYVSCDPATLSRDLVALLESGYRLEKMRLVDLFPQTYHLESVSHLALR
jgi:23S rRNA (uracil1939-C5)-methyltransferase